MTTGGMSRSLVQGIILKVGFPLLIALITLFAANIGGMQARNSLALAAVVGFAFALILFIVDTEIRISAVGERVTAGFAQIGRLAELSAKMERSSSGPRCWRISWRRPVRSTGRLTRCSSASRAGRSSGWPRSLRQLPAGSEIGYDGEDRDWMLGLTEEAQAHDRRDFAVHGGRRGARPRRRALDERPGLRYLELQREAVTRKVRIRRIFVVEKNRGNGP